MGKEIYFDNGSTSWPKAPGVAEAVSKLLANGAFNINRGNYEGVYKKWQGACWRRVKNWHGYFMHLIPDR